MNAWEAKRFSGTVRTLHERSTAALSGHHGTAAGAARTVHILEPTDRALVLGSTQHHDVADAEACQSAGFDIVRRRSGGGAVLVGREEVVWVDVFLPAGDPLWRDDVGKAAWWVGEAWARALTPELCQADVWRGAMVHSRWSALVCFAGVGPGEVVLKSGQKIVGISQRRGRRGALFQCACLLQWDAPRILGLVRMSDGERARAIADLRDVAVGLGATMPAEAILARFIAELVPSGGPSPELPVLRLHEA